MPVGLRILVFANAAGMGSGPLERFRLAAGTGTIRTKGRPALTITADSPCTATPAHQFRPTNRCIFNCHHRLAHADSLPSRRPFVEPNVATFFHTRLPRGTGCSLDFMLSSNCQRNVECQAPTPVAPKARLSRACLRRAGGEEREKKVKVLSRALATRKPTMGVGVRRAERGVETVRECSLAASLYHEPPRNTRAEPTKPGSALQSGSAS